VSVGPAHSDIGRLFDPQSEMKPEVVAKRETGLACNSFICFFRFPILRVRAAVSHWARSIGGAVPSSRILIQSSRILKSFGKEVAITSISMCIVSNLVGDPPATKTFQEAPESRCRPHERSNRTCDRARVRYGKRKKQMKEFKASPVFSLATTSGFISDWGRTGGRCRCALAQRTPSDLAGTQADQLYTIKEGLGIVPNRGWK